MYASYLEPYFGENSIKIGPEIFLILMLLKTIKKQREFNATIYYILT